MKKNIKSIALATVLALSSISAVQALTLAPQSCTGNLQQDTDYKKISVASSDSLAQKMQRDVVIEFFSYACIHCANLAPTVHKLEQSSPTVKAQIVYMPVVFRPDWEVAAKLYFALDSLGLATYENNAKIFKAVHTDKKKILVDNKEMQLFLNETFPDKAPTILEQMKGFNVANKISQSKQLAAKYQVDSTPLFVVDKLKGEQFRIDASVAQTPDRMMTIIDSFSKNNCK